MKDAELCESVLKYNKKDTEIENKSIVIKEKKLKGMERLLERIEIGLYAKWLANVTLNLDEIRYSYDTISFSFHWWNSKEGYDFWKKRDDKFKELFPWFITNLPDDKEYKEYSKRWYFRKKDGRTCVAAWIPNIQAIMVYAGCFTGTIDEFEDAAIEKYNFNSEENYASHIVWLRELELNLKQTIS